MRGCSCRGTAGFAHVSCLAEQAKILVAEAEENNLDNKAKIARFRRWNTCSMCKQSYHGVVKCALGWACWKTYVGRPEADWARRVAISVLGNGLSESDHHEDALSVQQAELSVERRVGAPEDSILIVQNNIANTYRLLGRNEEALCMTRDVYLGLLKLDGEESLETITAASNYASSLLDLQRFKETKALLRKTIPVARRVLGKSHDLTLVMKKVYAEALSRACDATLDELRESVTTLEDTERIRRRVFGGSHPTTSNVEQTLRNARAALRAREAPPGTA